MNGMNPMNPMNPDVLQLFLQNNFNNHGSSMNSGPNQMASLPRMPLSMPNDMGYYSQMNQNQSQNNGNYNGNYNGNNNNYNYNYNYNNSNTNNSMLNQQQSSFLTTNNLNAHNFAQIAPLPHQFSQQIQETQQIQQRQTPNIQSQMNNDYNNYKSNNFQIGNGLQLTQRSSSVPNVGSVQFNYNLKQNLGVLNMNNCQFDNLSNFSGGQLSSQVSGQVSGQGNVNNNNKKSKNGKKNEMRENQKSENGVTTHYYWRSGVWTTSKNDDCHYIKNEINDDLKENDTINMVNDNVSSNVSNNNGAPNWFLGSSMKPVLRVIEPHSMENINILSYFNDIKQKKQRYNKNSYHNQNHNQNHNQKHRKQGKDREKKIGVFKNYIFFSKKCTFQLERMIDENHSLIDTQRLYQFESRYFQYSLFQGKITFVQTNTLIQNENSKKEYLIFRFGHRSKYADKSALFGISQRNESMNCNHPNYQPWQCCDIVTESNILNYFNLKNATESAKLEFLSYLPQPLECQQTDFKSKLQFDANLQKISRILNQGSNKYQKDKKYQNNNDNNNGNHSDDDNNNKAKQSSVSPYHGPIISSMPNVFTLGSQASNDDNGNNNNDHNNNNSNNNNNSKSGYVSDSGSVCSEMSHASHASHVSARSGLSYASNASNGSVASTKSNKIKNEDKFRYLTDMCQQMGVSFDDLIDKILESIENAFKFAKKHPQTVLTQAYIDEEKCKIYYEPVLLAEVTDLKHMKTYKFAIPIVETKKRLKNNKPETINEETLTSENDRKNEEKKNDEKGGKTSKVSCYVAKNILTPQMAIENIMLNTRHLQYDSSSWVASMLDGLSYYERFDNPMASMMQNTSNLPKQVSIEWVASENDHFEPVFSHPMLSKSSNARKSVEIL